jgi:hypothetical protein
MRRYAMSVGDDMGAVRNDCVDMVMTYTKFISCTELQQRGEQEMHFMWRMVVFASAS